jgi:hypothetical protein
MAQEAVHKPVPDTELQYYSGGVGGGTLLRLALSGSVRNYSCAPIRPTTMDWRAYLGDMRRVTLDLVQYSQFLIREFEQTTKRTVSKFTIGKTYADKLPKAASMDPCDPKTWTMKGISSRWHTKYNEELYQTEVAMLAVSESTLPPSIRPPWNTPQNYILALEQALITHFAFAAHDPRLKQDSLLPGKGTGKGTRQGTKEKEHDFYVVYVAFGCDLEVEVEVEVEEMEMPELETMCISDGAQVQVKQE